MHQYHHRTIGIAEPPSV